MPGVRAAAFTSQLPLSGDYDAYGVRFESATREYESAGEGALRYVVTPDWFRTLRIPLLDRRLLDAQDRPDAPGAVLISESFARRRFGGRSPIGERVRIGPDNSSPERPWRTVVGVVGDVKQTSLALAPQDAFYVPLGQWPWADVVLSLVVRTDGDPAAFVQAVRAAIWSVDSGCVLDSGAAGSAPGSDHRSARRIAPCNGSNAVCGSRWNIGVGPMFQRSLGVCVRGCEAGLRSAQNSTDGNQVTRHEHGRDARRWGSRAGIREARQST